MGRWWIGIALMVLAFLLIGGMLPPLMPALSAQMAPDGWEGEALVGSTAITLAILYNRSLVVAILALVVVSVLAIIALATVVVAIVNRMEIQEGRRRTGDIWDRIEGGEPWRNS